MVAITTRAAKGAPLTHAEVDANFTGLKTAVEAMQSQTWVPTSIEGVSASGGVMTVTLTDGTTSNVTLPMFVPQSAVDWAPGTWYARGRLVRDPANPNGPTYIVDSGHTSAAAISTDIAAGRLGVYHWQEWWAATRGEWTTGTAYRAGDIASRNGMAVLCQADHTADASWWTDFAAGRWEVLTGLGGEASAAPNVIGTTAVLTIPTGLAWAADMPVRAMRLDDPTNSWITGTVQSYAPTVGDPRLSTLVIDVTDQSSPTGTGWRVVPAAGGSGGSGGGLRVVTIGSGELPYTATEADNGATLLVTASGSVTMPSGMVEGYNITVAAQPGVRVSVGGPFMSRVIVAGWVRWAVVAGSLVEVDGGTKPLWNGAGWLDSPVWLGGANSAASLMRQWPVRWLSSAGAATSLGTIDIGSADSNQPPYDTHGWEVRIDPGQGTASQTRIGGAGVAAGTWPNGPGTVTAAAGFYAGDVLAIDADALPRLPTYTVAALPTAADRPRALCWVSDGDAGAPCLAVSDGTDWRRIALGAAVSAT